MREEAKAKLLENPLMRLCAHYLFVEKRRGFALDSVGRFIFFVNSNIPFLILNFHRNISKFPFEKWGYDVETELGGRSLSKRIEKFVWADDELQVNR